MNLKKVLETVRKLDLERCWNNTSNKKLLEFLEEDVSELKKAKNKKRFSHKITDVFIILLQIANKNKSDIEKEFVGHFINAKKKYPRCD